MSENPAVVFPELGRVEIEDAEMPAVGPNEVLIKTHCSLISAGTELTVLTADFPPESAWAELVSFPARPGYSNVGQVIETGSDVDPSFVGRWVATFNRHARYVTADVNETGFRAVRWLPDGVTPEQASFFTLAEVAMNGIRRSGLQWGESTVVYGLGIIGQIVSRLCQIAGARPVIGVDQVPDRLAALPTQLPGIVAIDGSETDVQECVRELTQGQMAEVVFEVTGSSDLIPAELELLREQGRFVLIGASRGAGTFLNFHDACMRYSRTIIGAHYFSYPQHTDPALPWTPLRHAEFLFQLLATKELELDQLITHRFAHTSAADAYGVLVDREPGVMGVLLEWK